MSKECLENCGLAGVCVNCDAAKMAGQALFHLQHRGPLSVGLAASLKNGDIVHEVRPGLVKSNSDLFNKLGKTNMSGSAIGHVSLNEPQPFCVYTGIGPIGLAFSGNIINTKEIRKQVMSEGRPFATRDQVEALTSLIGRQNDPVQGIIKMTEQVKGSFSLVLLTENGIYAARDPFGFKPLIIGRGPNGCVVVSESPAITEIGLEIVRDVKPGEIILLKNREFTTVGQIPGARAAYCAFEWAYTARFDSVMEGIPVEQVRDNLGASLAKNDNVEADMVAPIPMSGIGYAQGYHRASGLRYRSAFLYNRFSGRSYTPLDQGQRNIIAAEKLSPIVSAVRGQRIILCDDSIVRGTQIRHQVQRLRAAGAKEIHVRVGVPPLIAPCRYGISTRSNDELIARQMNLEGIRLVLGADTLHYNSLDDLVAAIGLPRGQLCLACFTGEYPQ